MCAVEVICEKSFSGEEEEVIDKFIDFQYAIIEADKDKLDDILLDEFKLFQGSIKTKYKEEFVSKISKKIMDFVKSEIINLMLFVKDDNFASLSTNIRLTAKVNGREMRWISNSHAIFKKIDGTWYVAGWQI